MRYEYIELNLSTAGCAELLTLLDSGIGDVGGEVELREIDNLRNELRARLQRTDQDPKATLPPENWIDA